MRENISKIFVVLFLSFFLLIRPAFASFLGLGILATVTTATGFGIGQLFKDKTSKTPKDNNGKTTDNDTNKNITTPTINNIIFLSPGDEILRIKNEDKESNISISDISIDIPGVDIDHKFDRDLSPKEERKIILTATKEAYDKGNITVTYQKEDDDWFSDSKTISSEIAIAPTEIQLQEYNQRSQSWIEVPLNKEIILEQDNSKRYFRYHNVGEFDWQNENLKIDFKDSFSNTDVAFEKIDNGPIREILDSDSKCDEPKISKGESCVFTLKHNHPNHNIVEGSEKAIIEAKGENIGQTVYKNVLVESSFGVIKNFNPEDEHLSYRSIKIINTSKGTRSDRHLHLNILNVTSSDDNKVKYCDPNVANNGCGKYGVYKSGNKICKPGIDMRYKEYCLLWFKAEKDTERLWGLDNIDNDDIEITIETKAKRRIVEIPTPLDLDLSSTDKFNVSYEQALYVGGDFNQASGKNTNHIAKWDGYTWNSLDVGLDGNVYTITAGDDLLIGGDFSKAGRNLSSNISKWNGKHWKSFGNTIDGKVLSSTFASDQFYIGGEFTEIDGTMTNHVATWNGSVWSELGTGLDGPVYALTASKDNRYIYAGGQFGYAGGNEANNIAMWDIHNRSWSAFIDGLDNGLDNIVRALTVTDDGTLYAGGDFTDYFAKWDGSWKSLDNLLDDSVYALSNFDIDVFLGGNFTHFVSAWSVKKRGRDSFNQKDLGFHVHCLESLGNVLFVGGGGSYDNFSEHTNNIAMWINNNWTRDTWFPLEDGVNGVVKALAVAPSLVIKENH